MAFNPETLMRETVSSFEAALKAAYDQGVKDGIARIVAAAQSPLDEAKNDVSVPDAYIERNLPAISAKAARRAPRGLVPKVVGQMLAEHPGKIIAEYEDMAGSYDDRISTKSVGNELRRHEGTKYRRNDAGEWFPMSGNKEAAGTATNETPAASENANEGDTLWNRPS